MEYTIFYPQEWDHRNNSILPWTKLNGEMPPPRTEDGLSYESYEDVPGKVAPSDVIIYDTFDGDIRKLQENGSLCIDKTKLINQTVCRYLRSKDKGVNWKKIFSRIESPINAIIISDKYLFDNVKKGEDPYKNIKDIVDSVITKMTVSKLHLLIVFSTHTKNKIDFSEDEITEIKENAKDEFIKRNNGILTLFKDDIYKDKLTIELLAFNNVIGRDSIFYVHKKHYQRLHDRIILTNYTLGVATFRISAFLMDETPVQNQMIELKSIYNDINDDFNNPPIKEHGRVIDGIVDIIKFLRSNNEYGYYAKNGEIIEINEDTELENRLIKKTIKKK